MRVTVLASLSVTQIASAPTATAVGPAFGSTCRSDSRALRGLSRERSPEEGATQTALPRVATDPGAPGTTLPIRVALETVSNRGSICLTVTDGRVAFEPTTHTAPGEVASPVGVSVTGTLRVTARVAGSMRETVWSSRLATQSEPEP